MWWLGGESAAAPCPAASHSSALAMVAHHHLPSSPQLQTRKIWPSAMQTARLPIGKVTDHADGDAMLIAMPYNGHCPAARIGFMPGRIMRCHAIRFGCCRATPCMVPCMVPCHAPRIHPPATTPPAVHHPTTPPHHHLTAPDRTAPHRTVSHRQPPRVTRRRSSRKTTGTLPTRQARPFAPGSTCAEFCTASTLSAAHQTAAFLTISPSRPVRVGFVQRASLLQRAVRCTTHQPHQPHHRHSHHPRRRNALRSGRAQRAARAKGRRWWDGGGGSLAKLHHRQRGRRGWRRWRREQRHLKRQKPEGCQGELEGYHPRHAHHAHHTHHADTHYPRDAHHAPAIGLEFDFV